jgi:hypothetical protein
VRESVWLSAIGVEIPRAVKLSSAKRFVHGSGASVA